MSVGTTTCPACHHPYSWYGSWPPECPYCSVDVHRGIPSSTAPASLGEVPVDVDTSSTLGPDPCSGPLAAEDLTPRSSAAPFPAGRYTIPGSANGEEWRPVVGWLGRYLVSDHGRVWSIVRQKMMTLRVVRFEGRIKGLRVRLNQGDRRRDGIEADISVHKVVLEAFVGARPDGMQCRHLNGDPTDNRLTNIVWGSAQENADDKRRHGTVVAGERAGRAKLTDNDVQSIRAALAKGESPRLIGQRFGVSDKNVRDIRDGTIWKHLPSAQEANSDAARWLEPQPDPVGDGVSVTDWLIEALDYESRHETLEEVFRARRAQGVERYDRELRTNDGRDSLIDAFQEAVDLAMYLAKHRAEGGRHGGRFYTAVSLVRQILEELEER